MKKLTIICLLLMGYCAKAQVDPHFSQYYAFPLWLNPGMTGGFDGTVRVTAIYRNQWNSISAPYSTQGLAADVITNSNINIGASILNQTAGDAGFRYSTGSLSVAYSGIRFGNGFKQVQIGMNLGFMSRSFDPSKFQFGDQWDMAVGYNPSLPTADVITKNYASTLDIGAGVAYLDMTPDKGINMFGGFSAMHLNQPKDPFLNGIRESLPMRFAVHWGAKVTLTESASITPNILYMRQGNAEEEMVGVSTEMNLDESSAIIFGSNYRMGDAITPFVGFHYNEFAVGVSYDNNVSQLGKLVKTTNGYELSLSYVFKKEESKSIPCPRF